IAALAFHGYTPAEGLNRDFEIFLKTNRVHNVPAVHTEALLAAVEAIGLNHLRHAQKGGRDAAVLALGMLEVPSAAEVVFGAGATNGRELIVAVHIELDLAFAPPTAVVDAPRDIGANVVALALDAFQQ